MLVAVYFDVPLRVQETIDSKLGPGKVENCLHLNQESIGSHALKECAISMWCRGKECCRPSTFCGTADIDILEDLVQACYRVFLNLLPVFVSGLLYRVSRRW
jgi:hypothetical protein